MRLPAAIALIAGSILLVMIFPASAFWMACVLCVASLQWERSLIAVFFLFAALHCVAGYVLSFRGEESIYWLATGQGLWFAKAAFAIALGLFAMATAYRCSNHGQPTWINRLVIDEDRLLKVSRLAVIAAAAAMFYLYSRFSIIDLALQNLTEIGKLRYLGSESASDAYFVVRLSDVLVFTLPLFWLIRRTKWDTLLCFVGFVALLLPLRRAALFSVLFTALLVQARTIGYRKLVILLLVFIVIFGASQVALLSFTGNDASTSLASALSEVRDLGWAMELIHGNYFNGVTLIQPFDPFPGLIDSWKHTHSIAYITAELLNVDPESRSFGGLRITLAGEAFLNLWFFGPVIFGYMLGLCAAWARRSMQNATTMPIRYLSVMSFIWICLWLYIAGTQAVATLKFGVLVLFMVYFIARKRSPAVTSETMRPAMA